MTDSPRFTLVQGATLDGSRYVIERVLGQGGFGITYRATDTKLQRPVAIKEFFLAGSFRDGGTVHPSPTMTDQFLDRKERFREEARTLARFRHPGIVKVYEFFDENNTVYMVMEHLEGRSLGQILKMAGGMIQEDQAVTYALEIADALEAVHREGLLHRDVKPDNALVLDDGKVVLLDFGTARQFAAGGSAVMSQTLSPGYAPVEQYSERGRFGPATDVYALGATTYEMLTGQMPAGSIDRSVGHDLEPPAALNPRISPYVDDAVMWAMEMDPAERPPSAAAYADALRGNRPRRIAAGTVDVPDEPAPATRVVTGDRAPATQPAAEATQPAAAGPIASTQAAEPPATPPPPPDPPAGRDGPNWLLIGAAAVVALIIVGGLLVALRSGGDGPTVVGPSLSTAPPPPPTVASSTVTTAVQGTTSTTAGRATTTSPSSVAPPPTIPPDLTAACAQYGGSLAEERIQFSSGATSRRVGGALADGTFDSYVLGAGTGQTISVVVNAGARDLPYLVCLQGQSTGFIWSGLDGSVSDPLVIDEDVQVVVAALGDGGSYTMDVVIPPPVVAAAFGPGLFCRDIAATGTNYAGAVSYFVREGRPARMDADGNGIPCQTVFSPEEVEAQYFVAQVEPPDLFCRDLAARGWDFVSAIAYWVWWGGPDRMDADRNGIPCETVYSAEEIDAILYFDQ